MLRRPPCTARVVAISNDFCWAFVSHCPMGLYVIFGVIIAATIKALALMPTAICAIILALLTQVSSFFWMSPVSSLPTILNLNHTPSTLMLWACVVRVFRPGMLPASGMSATIACVQRKGWFSSFLQHRIRMASSS